MPVPVPPAEVEVDAQLVRRLLRGQHPDLASLPLRGLGVGWDTVVFRLGPDLTVRVPRRDLGARAVSREVRWLPGLAPLLPLAVPVPVRVGVPTTDFPWPWSICRFVPGRAVGAAGLAGESAGERLAEFLGALHRPAPPEAPSSDYRGVALARRDEALRAALAQVPPGERSALEHLWAAALDLPPYGGPRMWLHGDLHALNVLASRGRITGVVDFGDLCAGDPATDLAVAWIVLDDLGRARLRARYAGSAARWARGRGWAIYFSVMFLAHSHDAPENAAIGRRTLASLVTDAPPPG